MSSASDAQWSIKRGLVVWGVLLALLAGQAMLSRGLMPLRPGIEEMPFPLADGPLQALALGDQQFLFRVLGRWLQGVGDGDGRVRPLIDYDYDRVVAWLTRLDHLDPRSTVSFLLATQYFGAVMEPHRGPPRVAKIVVYLRDVGVADPATHWPGLVWAATRTIHIVKDPVMADRLGGDLAALLGNPAVPEWVPLLADPLYRYAGNLPAAAALEADPLWAEIRRRDLTTLLTTLGMPQTF